MMIHNSNLIKESLLKYETVFESCVPWGTGGWGGTYRVKPSASQPMILSAVLLATPWPGLRVGCLPESEETILGYTSLLQKACNSRHSLSLIGKDSACC